MLVAIVNVGADPVSARAIIDDRDLGHPFDFAPG